MNSKARRITPVDYEHIAPWWTGHDQVTVPPDYLSNVGFIVEGILALWVFKVTSSLYMLECLISNPGSTTPERDEAFKEIMKSVMEYTREAGGKALVVLTNHPKVISNFKSQDFTVAETGLTQLVGAV
jgi:hypothetical protein